MNCKLTFPGIFKNFCTSVRATIVPNSNVIHDIDTNVYKFRKHPGVVFPRTVTIPENFVKSVINVLADYPVKSFIEPSEKLCRHLKCRVAPMEKFELKEKVRNIQERVLQKQKDIEINTIEEEMNYRQVIQNKIQRAINENLYNWKPVKYDARNALLYLIGRSAAEYSVLVRIFSEIESRDPDFKPRSIFDYGSGVGTVTWAANIYWKKYILEYFNVDTSREMNDLAQILLQGGKGTGNMPIKGVFYRQFLPSTPLTYDIVVSAYSLFELPSFKSRLETVVNLWNKTAKYLVIVEHGTNAGFRVVNEIRDFLLKLNEDGHKCTIFSPCPHDNTCPRFLLDDGTPCNFEVTYHSLPISTHSKLKKELYSYIVLKKCKSDDKIIEERWPRLVRPTLVRSKHTICRMCTSSGKLQEVVVTASKYGKTMYHCARSTKWGDCLPVSVKDVEKNKIKD
ncbi:methyltransferase-like protein 17, mitochondrial isoform X1 [Diorhabda sublineata]|uniref:methyltransferase-like protein 17, mitochondrial isoform X1 n=1 Tax=Diorhabda sublineata TaxID=1163346 RepID=UPI0024E11C23|nr:methyltransferase-like protein 17, mitochondrial isoform X1 [Diorhabda sublineata]